MRNIFYSTFIILIFSISNINAQGIKLTKAQQKQFTKEPEWITMMEDSNANYYLTIAAYDQFWKNREKPTEEDEIIGEGKPLNKRSKLKMLLFDWLDAKERREAQKYKLDCKKFEHWKLVNFPYVQEDGRILSKDEQLKIWKETRRKIKN